MSQSTARTAADLPKDTRVVSTEGRLGTVNGVDVGRVTEVAHPNCGREYVGVNWDAIEGDMGCNRRSRSFVDELVIVSDTDEVIPSQESDEYAPSRAAAIEAARIALADLKATGWKANPIYWVGRLEAALEQTLKAIDKTEGREAQRAEADEVTEAARHGETVRLHRATCSSQTNCTAHGIDDKRGGRATELGAILSCEPGTTYGAWSEGAGGFVYTGDCATEVANWAADELRQLAKEDDTDRLEILAICSDHEEQPKVGCEECAVDGEDG